MGTKLAVNGSRNLYEFWADAITNDLVKELKSDSILVNLASNEYFNVIKNQKLSKQSSHLFLKILKMEI